MTISNNTGSTNITKSGFITVNATPDADFSFTNISANEVTFTNETQFDNTLPTYSWDFGDGETSAVISPTHIYDDNGVYEVELAASNTCGNSNSTKLVMVMTVGTDEVFVNSDILIYPNPSKDFFMVKIEGKYIGEYEIALVNNLGQIISVDKVEKASSLLEYQLNGADLPTGNYFLRIGSEYENQVKRIIKE